MKTIALNLLGMMTESALASSPGHGATVSDSSPEAAETVVTLHGLGRTRISMLWLGRQFEQQGYRLLNLSYPSTRQTVRESAEDLRRQLEAHSIDRDRRVHFVTHSLGGIVLRAYLQQHRPPNLGRVVMLGPPNQGSELADRLSKNAVYRWATGPAGQELGTDAASVPNRLGPVDYDVGIIAGEISFNPLFSSWIRGKNDGKVSVDRAAVEGMSDLVVVRHSHSFMMRSRDVAAQAAHFIAHGRFEHSPE